MVRHHRQRFLSFSSPCYLTYSSYQDTKFPEQTQCRQRKMTESCNEMQPRPTPNAPLSWTRAHRMARKRGLRYAAPLICQDNASHQGVIPCQASFSVRHLILSGILPFQSMDHIHHKLVAWHRYAHLCRSTDNRTADGIHLTLPAVP